MPNKKIISKQKNQNRKKILKSPPAYSEKVCQIIKQYHKNLQNHNLEKTDSITFITQTAIELNLPLEDVKEALVNNEYLENKSINLLKTAKLNEKEVGEVKKIVQCVVLNLRQYGLSDIKIKSAVTEVIKKVLDELKTYGKIDTKACIAEWRSLIKGEEDVPQQKRSKVKKQSFLYSTGIINPTAILPETAEEIQEQLLKIINNLESLSGFSSDSAGLFKKKIHKEVFALARIGLVIDNIEGSLNGGDKWMN
jgi:hypothetical protein